MINKYLAVIKLSDYYKNCNAIIVNSKYKKELDFNFIIENLKQVNEIHIVNLPKDITIIAYDKKINNYKNIIKILLNR